MNETTQPMNPLGVAPIGKTLAYAGFMADGITFLFATVMWFIEFKKM